MTADLSALIARLEAAEVGSRELDWDVGDALDLTGDEEKLWFTNPVTQSLDAALALAERVLPGWSYSAIKGRDRCEAYVWPHAEAFADVQGKSSTPALALCIAVLKAKQEPKP